MNHYDHEYWMNEALKEAGKAAAMDEIPVGAVIVLGEECLARAFDQRESTADPTNHAEMIAIREAARQIGDWRLCDCLIYVTLEPCPMCAGAILLSRIKHLVYGAINKKFGAVETHCQLLSLSNFNHKVEVTSGILSDECSELLRDFFQKKR